LLAAPILQAVERIHGKIQVTAFMEGFLIRAQISLVGGLILAMPFIYRELWAFVSPALRRDERRMLWPLVPVSGVLFVGGVALAYLMTEPSIVWMASMNPPGTEAWYRLNENLLLILKFYLAFGLAFQLPLALVLLAAVGIVDSRLLMRRWREASVAIFIIAAVITPTWDPITMTVCALPMVVLYWATIWVVRVIERKRARRDEEQPLAG
jgi:sec-independent protein translocase protein TatC